MSEAKNKNIEAIYHLSPTQEGMLMETISNPEAGLHIEQSVCELQGELNIPAFEYAWRQVVDRHPMFRTAFVWKSQNEPLQAVLRQVEVSIAQADWSALAKSKQQEQLEEYLQNDRKSGFNLSKPPVMRLALFKTGAREQLFVWSSQHLLMDGWCIPIVLKEVSAFYRGFLQGTPPDLPPPRPFKDYIGWLKERDLTGAHNYWRDQLKGYTRPTPLGVEADFATPGQQEAGYGAKSIRLAAQETAALQDLASQRHLTISSIIQGVWAVLLARYSKMNDVVFGTTVSGRPPELAGIESTIGLFINTLPFRVKIDEGMTVLSLLEKVQSQHSEMREYEYCSSGQIHGWSDLPGILPLYDSLMVHENYPESGPSFAANDLTFQIRHTFTRGAQTKKPLLILSALDSGLTITLIFDGHRISAASIDDIVKHIQALLPKIIGNPDLPVAELQAEVPETEIPRVKPSFVEQQLDQNYVAPRNPLEKALAKIFAGVLKFERIGVRDNIFAIGGNSISTSQIASRVRETLEVDLPLNATCEAPTIGELAQYITEKQPESARKILSKEGVTNGDRS